MLVYYYISGGKQVGSLNIEKIQKIALTNGIHTISSCSISDFTGHLLSSEWLD